jgi:hypothetical protein
MPATIDSNKSSLTYAEETSLKVLPVTPVWYPLEPNTYPNFGGDLKTTAREPINASRQRSKGTVTDLVVTAGFNTDMTQYNLTRLFQGFFFSHARQKPQTQPLNGAPVVVTGAVAGTPGSFTAAAGIGFGVGKIIKASNFNSPQNNGIFRSTVSAAGSLTCAGYKASAPVDLIVTEAAPPANAALEVVGQVLSGDVLLYVPGSTLGGATVVMPTLASAATIDFTTLGLIVGEWVYLGDSNDDLVDTAATEFNFLAVDPTVRNRGYCRVYSISAHQLVFDIAIGVQSWAVGAGIGGACAVPTSGFVSLYCGTVIRNEPLPANIVRTTYTLQRYLGKGVANADNLEYVLGAIPNELTLNVKANSKLDCDMLFVPMDTQQNHLASLPGTYLSLLREDAYNTSQDVFAMLLYILNSAPLLQAPLFGFATDAKTTIKNNVSGDKAIGVVGSFEGTAGNFDLSGSLSCYFDDVAAQQAVRNNSDVGLTQVFSKQNSGFILDLPLITLALTGLKVVKDKPIMGDVTFEAAADRVNNYTALYNRFSYLPDSAMASYAG